MGPIILLSPILIGQAAEAFGVDEGRSPTMFPGILAIMLIGLAALAIVVGLPVVLGIRSERRRREMEHAERMRAIELGRPMPGEADWWTPARTAAGIGVGVPIGVFGIGWIAALTSGAAAPFIWPSAGAVGVAAVICGTILASRPPAPQPTAHDPHSKPYVDPDSYAFAEHHHS